MIVVTNLQCKFFLTEYYSSQVHFTNTFVASCCICRCRNSNLSTLKLAMKGDTVVLVQPRFLYNSIHSCLDSCLSLRPTVHTNPSRKRSFSKPFFKPEEFENAGFSFSCGRKTFWKRNFLKTMTSRESCDFPAQAFSNTNPTSWLLGLEIPPG